DEVLRLKSNLQEAIYKGDHRHAIEVILSLDKLDVGPSILENTRVARTVNEGRRSTKVCWPDFADLARQLLKKWLSENDLPSAAAQLNFLSSIVDETSNSFRVRNGQELLRPVYLNGVEVG
ncbi:hypothetical protein PENTCL1PPCAC_1384, partial [Pristionchus entomophagus]